MASEDADLEKKIKGLNLSDKIDINILLLGETGVGKSTFINSVANYLSYTNLKRAEEGNLLTLIPSKYNIQDKKGEFHIIKTGNEQDQNEYLDTGVSATQDVKTYVFPIWGGQMKVRLIDTPGMGDTRGIQQDDINCENILSYIGQLHELHAICFLFKPTNTRLTTFFGYCMSQILSRLDKTASKNIIFIFTNTRGTDYGPGETFPLLQEVVREIESKPPNVKIPFNRNIFCFDNEPFRYLAAMKQGVEFDNAVKQRINESWRKSVDQCWGLIKYIVGDAKNAPLKPHFIKSTSAINEARRLVVQLSQPLAEITQLINDNLLTLQRHERNLNVNNNSLEELRKRLYMPVINLNVIKLTQPTTVCGSSSCAEIYKVNDINKWHYKQRCHDPCYLTNVPKETLGSPELINCAAMSGKKCTKCLYNCDFSVHMHIYYLTETKEDHVVDSNVQKDIDNKEHVLQHARKLINDISQRKSELEKEYDVIVKCCARFAHFLQNNAITPFSDFYQEYINYLIVRERSLGVSANMAMVQQLQKLLREYEEAKTSFDQALELQKKLGESDVYVTPQKIHETIHDLYKLKHNGKKIRELYECQKKSRSKEFENTEYVHKVVSVKSGNSENKKEKKKDKKGSDDKPQHKPQQKPKEKKESSKTHTKNTNKSDNQQRQRTRSPPPNYHDATRHVQPHPTHNYSAHGTRPYYNQPPPPPTHTPGPYTPPPPAMDPYYDLRGATASGYEFKISVNRKGEPTPPPTSSYYGHPYPHSPHPPPQGSYPPPQGSYPPPQGSYHPPPGPYAPQHGPYPPPPGSYHAYPPPPNAYQHPPRPHPQHYNSSENVAGPQQGRGRGRGRGARGGRGRGFVNKTQKFKPGYKKRNTNKDDSDDSDSDTSATSSNK